MLGKVTFDEQVNVLERYCNGYIINIYKTLMALFPKSKVLKSLVLRSVYEFIRSEFPIRIILYWLLVGSYGERDKVALWRIDSLWY